MSKKNKNRSKNITVDNKAKKTEEVKKSVDANRVSDDKVKLNKAEENKAKASKEKVNKTEINKAKASKEKVNKTEINKAEVSKSKENKIEVNKTKASKTKSQKDDVVANRAAKKAEEKIRKAEEKKAKEAAEKAAKEKELAEKEERGIEININLKTKHMYEFQMRHTYRRMSGVISVAFSVGAFVYFLITRQHNEYMTNLLLVFASLMFTVIYPLQMLQRSLQLVKLSPVLSRTLNYTFTTEGILVSQDNDDALLPWENIMKVVETRRLILVYSSPKNGYILPKAQYKEECAGIKAMIKKLVNKDICKLQLRED